MNNQTNLKMTRNTSENAADLSYGDGYWIEYYDWKSGEIRAAIGIAAIGSRFTFPALRTRDIPTMTPREGGNYIIGWYRAKDWRQHDDMPSKLDLAGLEHYAEDGRA